MRQPWDGLDHVRLPSGWPLPDSSVLPTLNYHKWWHCNLADVVCFLGVIGLVKASDEIIGIAFDILSLEALFLVPRYAPCSKLCDLRCRWSGTAKDIFNIEFESLCRHFGEHKCTSLLLGSVDLPDRFHVSARWYTLNHNRNTPWSTNGATDEGLCQVPQLSCDHLSRWEIQSRSFQSCTG